MAATQVRSPTDSAHFETAIFSSIYLCLRSEQPRRASGASGLTSSAVIASWHWRRDSGRSWVSTWSGDWWVLSCQHTRSLLVWSRKLTNVSSTTAQNARLSDRLFGDFTSGFRSDLGHVWISGWATCSCHLRRNWVGFLRQKPAS